MEHFVPNALTNQLYAVPLLGGAPKLMQNPVGGLPIQTGDTNTWCDNGSEVKWFVCAGIVPLNGKGSTHAGHEDLSKRVTPVVGFCLGLSLSLSPALCQHSADCRDLNSSCMFRQFFWRKNMSRAGGYFVAWCPLQIGSYLLRKCPPGLIEMVQAACVHQGRYSTQQPFCRHHQTRVQVPTVCHVTQ